MLEKLTLYFEYPFVRYALIVGILIALSSSLLGVVLVLKNYSFIGDSLSHVAFGAMAVATALKLTNSTLVVLPVTILCAVLLLRRGEKAKIKGDAALAMLSVGSLALGYLTVNLFSSSANLSGDVCAVLFGSTSILTLRAAQVWISVLLCTAVILFFVLCYQKLFAITFDENFAQATGTNKSAYQLLLAVVIACVVVLAMDLVGSLLISALVIFPAMAAMRLFKSFRAVILCAAIFSVVCAALGILLSILAGTPVGSTIVAIDFVGFILFWAAGAVSKGICR